MSTTRDTGDHFVEIARDGDLAEGDIVPVTVAGQSLLLVRSSGATYVCGRLCPHQKADLALGRVAEGRLVCPRHLASFDLDDGKCSPGWQLDRLRLYPVRIARGTISVDGDALRRDPPDGLRKLWDFSR